MLLAYFSLPEAEDASASEGERNQVQVPFVSHRVDCLTYQLAGFVEYKQIHRFLDLMQFVVKIIKMRRCADFQLTEGLH